MANCIFTQTVDCDTHMEVGCLGCCSDGRDPIYSTLPMGVTDLEKTAMFVECIFNFRMQDACSAEMNLRKYETHYKCNAYTSRLNCIGFVRECIVRALNRPDMERNNYLKPNELNLNIQNMSDASVPLRGALIYFFRPRSDNYAHVMLYLGNYNGYHVVAGMNHGDQRDLWKRQRGIYRLDSIVNIDKTGNYLAEYPLAAGDQMEIRFCNTYE